jgi:hypothetical protein
MEERKKRTYGKAGNKKLNAEEEGKIRNETMRKRELAEIKQNLWRAYRENGKETLAPKRSKKVPEGRKNQRSFTIKVTLQWQTAFPPREMTRPKQKTN